MCSQFCSSIYLYSFKAITENNGRTSHAMMMISMNLIYLVDLSPKSRRINWLEWKRRDRGKRGLERLKNLRLNKKETVKRIWARFDRKDILSFKLTIVGFLFERFHANISYRIENSNDTAQTCARHAFWIRPECLSCNAQSSLVELDPN